jgi:hypothetical protein
MARADPKQVLDEDKNLSRNSQRDYLPGQQVPEMELGDPVTGSIIARLKAFEYSFDSGGESGPDSQKYFPYGAKAIYQGNEYGGGAYVKDLQYQGDQIPDANWGIRKDRLIKINPFDPDNIPSQPIDLPLPENLPIEEVKAEVYVGLTKVITANVTDAKKVPLSYEGVILEEINRADPKKPTVKLWLSLSQQTIGEIKSWRDRGKYSIEGLYIYYVIQSPKKHFGVDEYDASRMEPGRYHGWRP